MLKNTEKKSVFQIYWAKDEKGIFVDFEPKKNYHFKGGSSLYIISG
jgi:hypothetical protein